MSLGLFSSLATGGGVDRPVVDYDLTLQAHINALQNNYSGTSGKTYINEAGEVAWAPENLQGYASAATSFSKARATIADSGELTPDGLTAYEVECTSTSAFGAYVYYNNSEQALSVGERVYVCADFYHVTEGIAIGPQWTDNGTDTFFIAIDSAGVVQDTNLGSVITDYGVTALGGGWYRVWIEVTSATEGADFARYGIPDAEDGDVFRVGRMIVTRDKTMTWVSVPGSTPVHFSRPCSYYPDTLAARGLMLEEEARTNLVPDSIECDNGWGLSANCTTTTRQATGPDGVADSATLLAATGANARKYYFQVVGIADGAQVCQSYWFKAGTIDDPSISFYRAGTGRETQVSFDLAAETPTVESDPNSWHVASGMEQYPNGWWRCWVVAENKAGVVVNIYAEMFPGSNYAGTQNGDNCYVWGGQFEVGEWPSSFIPTKAGATATRVAEELIIPVTVPDTGEYTVLWDGDIPHNDGELQVPWEVSDGAYTDSLRIDCNAAGGNMRAVAYDGAALQVLLNNTALSTEHSGKIAVGFAEADSAMSIEGLSQTTDTTPGDTIPSGLNQIQLGGGGLISYGMTYHRSLKLWATRKSNAELENLVGN